MDTGAYNVLSRSSRLWNTVLFEPLKICILRYLHDKYSLALLLAKEQGNISKNKIYRIFQTQCFNIAKSDILMKDFEQMMLYMEKSVDNLQSVIEQVLRNTFSIMSVTRVNDTVEVKLPRVSSQEFVKKCLINCAIDVGYRYPFAFDKQLERVERLQFYQKACSEILKTLEKTTIQMLPLNLITQKTPRSNKNVKSTQQGTISSRKSMVDKKKSSSSRNKSQVVEDRRISSRSETKNRSEKDTKNMSDRNILELIPSRNGQSRNSLDRKSTISSFISRSNKDADHLIHRERESMEKKNRSERDSFYDETKLYLPKEIYPERPKTMNKSTMELPEKSDLVFRNQKTHSSVMKKSIVDDENKTTEGRKKTCSTLGEEQKSFSERKSWRGSNLEDIRKSNTSENLSLAQRQSLRNSSRSQKLEQPHTKSSSKRMSIIDHQSSPRSSIKKLSALENIPQLSPRSSIKRLSVVDNIPQPSPRSSIRGSFRGSTPVETKTSSLVRSSAKIAINQSQPKLTPRGSFYIPNETQNDTHEENIQNIEDATVNSDQDSASDLDKEDYISDEGHISENEEEKAETQNIPPVNQSFWQPQNTDQISNENISDVNINSDKNISNEKISNSNIFEENEDQEIMAPIIKQKISHVTENDTPDFLKSDDAIPQPNLEVRKLKIIRPRRRITTIKKLMSASRFRAAHGL